MANPSDVLGEILLDTPTPAQAFVGLFTATVAANVTTGQADITLDGFDTKATYSARFEPRFGSHSTAQTPPTGTKCLVAFTSPIAFATQDGKAVANVGVGAAVWIVAFSGWPT